MNGTLKCTWYTDTIAEQRASTAAWAVGFQGRRKDGMEKRGQDPGLEAWPRRSKGADSRYDARSVRTVPRRMMLAWMGADVIKIEMPRRGDITRSQLRDRSNVDSLYFAMLNGNKRSVTLNIKSQQGQDALTASSSAATCSWRISAPACSSGGLLLRTHQRHQSPDRLRLDQGLRRHGRSGCQGYETIAQAMGGAMSTTGWQSGPPTASSAQVGDTGTGIPLRGGHPCSPLPAHGHRPWPAGGRGHAGLRDEHAAGEAAGPAAPRLRALTNIPARRAGIRAAGRQCFRRRPAGRGPALRPGRRE